MFQKDKLFWLLVEACRGIKQFAQLGSKEMYDLLDYFRNFYTWGSSVGFQEGYEAASRPTKRIKGK